MFSVVFPGQGSQEVGMGKILYEKFDLVKNYFKEADETLNFAISKLVLDGPKSDLNLTFTGSDNNPVELNLDERISIDDLEIQLSTQLKTGSI